MPLVGMAGVPFATSGFIKNKAVSAYDIAIAGDWEMMSFFDS